MRGEREGLPEGPRKSFQLAFCDCGYFQLVARLPREKLTALGEKNCQSILHEQRSEGLTLHHQLLKPLNGIIEVQVSEVTSVLACSRRSDSRGASPPPPFFSFLNFFSRALLSERLEQTTSVWFNGTMCLSSPRKVEMFKRYSRRKVLTSDTH